MLSIYQLTEDDIRNSADHLLPPENSLPGMAAPGVTAGSIARLPTMELMKVSRSTCPLLHLDGRVAGFTLFWKCHCSSSCLKI